MTERRKQFPFDQFESKWQAIWEKNKTFAVANPGDADFDASKLKYFVLDMYPYPSGDGLHVGHPEGYTATDIIGRYKARRGYNVLHPMGWDAFGLPAEQHAIKTGEHPRINTANNIENFRRQLKSLGFAYDWDREINTTDPEYVKWTQWIFLQLYNSYFDEKTQKARPVSELEEQGLSRDEIDELRLAYVAETPVNWSPDLGTVLANEEVEEWRAKGHAVERRPLRQWMLRITSYAQRLIDELDDLDWPEGIKLLQKNWIGRSDGAEVTFQIGEQSVTVFTTRPDTLYGATYMVLAPEHTLVDQIASDEQKQAIADYRVKCGAKSDLERTELAKEKSGVFTGGYAVNPVNGEKIPVWIADYVLMSYGTGAIMAVPAHDQRDYEFAQQYDIPMIEVVKEEGGMGFQPMNREENIQKKQGAYLPHWSQKGATYALNFRLGDSLPITVVESWKRERDKIVAAAKQTNRKLSQDEAKRLRHLYSSQIESFLDEAHGECWLKNPEIASLIKGALLHFEGERYHLDAWCIMPNHVHVVVRPFDGQNLQDIVHSWKSFTANKANEKLNREGEFWQAEVYDHLIRDEKDWRHQVDYVLNNPVKAGLTDWEWVSEANHEQNLSVGTSTQSNHEQDAHATCFPGEGMAINSPMFEGLTTAEAKEKICAWLEEKGLGRKTVNYKLRDWLFSRQRYWGEPFPIVWRDGKHEALAESDLPLLAPELEDYKPSGTPEPLLSKATDWVNCGEGLKRETNTMPQWAGSCWYYLRYCDAKNSERFVSRETEDYWMNVDLYIGGTEHAVLHLLYARFWHKVLHDLGHVSTVEPFQKLVNQGLIMGDDGVKMSKSRGNVVNPDDVVEGYGADALRLYEMFMGPLEQVKPWSMKGVEGVYRFLGRVWRLVMEVDQEGEWSMLSKVQKADCDKKTLKVLHQTIKKVSEDIESLSFNTAISQMMVCTNELNKLEVLPLSAVKILLSVLNPFAPHLSEELHSILAEAFPDDISGELSQRDWPQWEEVYLIEDEIEIVVQVNGKLRDRITVSKDADKDEVEKLVLDRAKVKEHIDGKTVRKVIVVPGRLVNVVAN